MRLINVIRLHKKVSCAIHNCRAHDHVWVMTPVEAQRRASTFCSHRADRCVNCWRAQSSVWHLISGVISSSAALEPAGRWALNLSLCSAWGFLIYCLYMLLKALMIGVDSVCLMLFDKDKAYWIWYVLKFTSASVFWEFVRPLPQWMWLLKQRSSFTATELQLIFELKTRVVHP